MAGLRLQGETADDIAARVARENLFQYPTKVMLADRARVCCDRLDALGAGEAAETLVSLIATGTPDQAAQANLYAMMRRYNLVCVFMVEEIGERLANLNSSFTRADLNAFFTRYQMQNAAAAAWSDETVKRTKGTLSQCLTQAGFLASPKSEELLPVLLDYQVEQAIRRNGDAPMLRAFGMALPYNDEQGVM